ncbi:protein kinase domain-containing protein [Kitasatospora sp. NBC_01266]|uniref:protein kinase domain-containing protein n=1 Tax=Kitasatospora sp. NBC_01266 TaxID=2903572 RepID=UPI002E34B7D3|nr:protein kinase [Kitasatospora sp. NBC_01266]
MTTETGRPVTVTGYLGAGGQGEVYRVRTDQGDRALKWYFPQSATENQLQIVEDLVARGITDDRFLWPEEVVSDGADGFGYLMGLRPDRYQGLPSLFSRQMKTSTRALLTAGIHLVEAYKSLHSQGVAYRDISWGNVFFDPLDGSVLICDNDNAVPEGEASGISGTMDFMAPELVRGDDGAVPRTQTDLHSLSVLLFMMLMNHHPLKGALELKIRCWDEAAERRMYGSRPLFVFDPDDVSNRPDPMEQGTVLATWAAAPPILRRLFQQNFTEGLRDPDRRVRESQWRDVLSQVRDTMVVCANCGRPNMTEPTGTSAQTCWSCSRTLVMPPWLVVTTSSPQVARTVRLGHGAQLYGHHLSGEPDRHDFSDSAVIAELAENPQKPGRYGLTNRTPATSWSARRSDGTTVPVPPGRSVPLREGLRVDLGGGTEAVVHTS